MNILMQSSPWSSSTNGLYPLGQSSGRGGPPGVVVVWVSLAVDEVVVVVDWKERGIVERILIERKI